jgi:Flp pilus assembly protein TadG
MLIRTRSGRRRGAAMVEASVGLVILLFVIFGIIEYAQLIMARQLLNNATVTMARMASVNEQPATYPDGTATPSPGGDVTTTFLNTWVSKSMAVAPLSNVTASIYGANGTAYIGGTPNTTIAWTSMQFGQGFYVTITGTYIPLFSGNRLYADSTGNKGPMVGSVTLTRTVYVSSEANQ